MLVPIVSEEELSEIRRFAGSMNVRNSGVSAVSVGWHLVHLLKVISGIYDALEHSDPAKYQWKPNVLRTLVWATGKMHRGAGEAPRSVRPADQVTREDFDHEFSIATDKLSKFMALHARAYFRHFAFGNLNRANAARFVRIHTLHHLAIVRDILSKE